MSCDELIDDNTKAQLNQNTLESLSKETNVLGDNAQISVGKKPSYISGGLHVIYVANTDSGTISVIDKTTSTVIGTINVDVNPVAIFPHNNYVYVANQGSNSVSVIDPKKIV